MVLQLKLFDYCRFGILTRRFVYDGKVPCLHHLVYRMELGRVDYLFTHDTLGTFYSGLYILHGVSKSSNL